MTKNIMKNELIQWAGVRDTAKHLGVSERTIHKWKRKGLLPYTRMGGRIFFDLGKVDETLKSFQFCKLV